MPARSVGDNEAQQAQLSAVTKEATAKALLITIKKLQVCIRYRVTKCCAPGSVSAVHGTVPCTEGG